MIPLLIDFASPGQGSAGRGHRRDLGLGRSADIRHRKGNRVTEARASGPFQVGDRVQLTDPKGRHYTLVLTPGDYYHTHRGAVAHDDLIGQDEGSLVTSAGGTAY